MAIYALGDDEPIIDPLAFVHPEATVIGRVSIGPDSSIWPGTVLRGDPAGIVIGEGTSVQDGAVIHCLENRQTLIGDRCTVGHNVHMEGCTIADEALVGSGSIVLPFAEIGSGSIVGANAVVTEKTIVPPLSMALGVPAKIREGVVAEGTTLLNAHAYIERCRYYRENLRRID